ncbi:MAG TPA: GNAT family N-acetyltransferase [Gaiellaceae bacterium]|jgi:GNAT superfamily N-acetyltransferase
MKKELPGGYELDDSAARIDVAAVHDFLSTQSYWAKGRPYEIQERLVQAANRVVGLYHENRQIGFARTVSDGVVIAYLADVYVLPEYRGRGFGAMIVRFSVEEGPFARLRWCLHTVDAHGLYKKFGFAPPNARTLERQSPE